jgi:hypothetical protein
MCKRGRVRFAAPCVPANLLVGMAGCGTNEQANDLVPAVSPTVAISSSHAAAPTPSPSPTWFPVVGRVTPTSTTGWATYRDAHYPFRVPLPPGWRPGSYTGATPGTALT